MFSYQDDRRIVCGNCERFNQNSALLPNYRESRNSHFRTDEAIRRR